MKKLMMILLVGTLGYGTSVMMTEKEETNGYNIGDVATDFSLKGIDGKKHTLSEIEGAKGYVVVFTCNHCPFAKMYEDRIIALQAEFGPKGYPIIAINPNDPIAEPDDSFAKMKERAKEKGFNFLYLLDDGQKIYPQYGATKTPHVFLLNEKRVVQYIGAIDDNARDEAAVKEKFLANAINALIKGEKISPAVTKAIGCSIKTK
ncbi:thioredoxin family protein [Putridiphycobacter roseus]|uniref:Thioredoxin family protein n=1 Tax=Putridiphycobacter roseus TaxID=2219161 RepID=A0A2W1NEH4_9FLAO|nr:thioredoxin family protein [Putridiphycobacter roseus]PZE17503.1 thioredoxin family protein [Putridiphycobacter roseus]